MLKDKEELTRHRGMLRMQDSLGLERACAKAENLEEKTQTAHYGWSIREKWWQMSPEHSSQLIKASYVTPRNLGFDLKIEMPVKVLEQESDMIQSENYEFAGMRIKVGDQLESC